MASVTIKVTVETKMPTPKEGKKKAGEWLANEIHKDMDKLVPYNNGDLKKSGKVLEAANGRYDIIYSAPYARYMYYGKVMKNAKTGRGPHWFDNVGFRWPKGATLVATSRELVYNREWHRTNDGQFFWAIRSKGNPNATDHWFTNVTARYKKKYQNGVALMLKGGGKIAE